MGVAKQAGFARRATTAMFGSEDFFASAVQRWLSLDYQSMIRKMSFINRY